MELYTNNKEYAENTFKRDADWQKVTSSQVGPKLRDLCGRLFFGQNIYRSDTIGIGCWQHAFLVDEAPSSHYDLMVELSGRKIELPHGIICLAGSGRNFHGQRGRPWNTQPGNIHLTAYLQPNRPVQNFHIGFSLLAAVSVIDAIDSISLLAGRGRIKWVNDVLIDGAKVAGFLANTASQADTVTASVLGIGLNVETTPEVPPDDITPSAASLRDFVFDPSVCNQGDVLMHLLEKLSNNYSLLLDGRSGRLLDVYRRRSLIIGRKVKIISDPQDGPKREIAAGKVLEIGDNLELILEGVKEPVTSGRLILAD
jgi:BirA family biotin operon repressor/biotin-[acetyl-CoA-carboxylase] ligase